MVTGSFLDLTAMMTLGPIGESYDPLGQARFYLVTRLLSAVAVMNFVCMQSMSRSDLVMWT